MVCSSFLCMCSTPSRHSFANNHFSGPRSPSPPMLLLLLLLEMMMMTFVYQLLCAAVAPPLAVGWLNDMQRTSRPERGKRSGGHTLMRHFQWCFEDAQGKITGGGGRSETREDRYIGRNPGETRRNRKQALRTFHFHVRAQSSAGLSFNKLTSDIA